MTPTLPGLSFTNYPMYLYIMPQFKKLREQGSGFALRLGAKPNANSFSGQVGGTGEGEMEESWKRIRLNVV